MLTNTLAGTAYNPIFQFVKPSPITLNLLGPLDSRWTFSRASSGTQIQSGVLSSVGTNVARFETSPAGYLNEPQATNLYLQSNFIGTSPWGAASNNASFGVFQNNATAPDGTLTATKYVSAATSGSQYAFVYQASAGTAASYTKSVWLKGDVGGEVVYLISTLGTTSYSRTLCTLTTAWQRFSVTDTETAATWYLYLGVDLRDVGQSATPAQTYYAWGAQCELGAFATSLIPTTTAVATRATDNLTLDLTQLPGLQTPTGYSCALEFSLLSNTQSQVVFGMSGSGGFANTWYFGETGAGGLAVTTIVATAGQTSATATLRAVGLTNRLALTVTPSGITFNLNGAGDVTVANAGMPVMTTLAVLRAPWGAFNYEAGHATLVTLVPGPQSAAWRASRSY
jgi:hypothetical protein